MNENNQITIDEYTNYLIKLNFDTTKIYTNIKTIEDIKSYDHSSKSNLDKLEKLSTEYKLYDSNYKEFMISMGRLAIGLNKSDELEIDIDNKNKFIDRFVNFHTKFEDLEFRNIMKDAYVWN